jgi:beta-galactosidase
MTLMNWETFNLPLDEGEMGEWSKEAKAVSGGAGRGPLFFKGSFELDGTADTYLDMSGFKKGVVWINGHNLGRYWYVGPQQRLYCPAPWLKKGRNEVVVLDLHQQQAAAIKGVTTLY